MRLPLAFLAALASTAPALADCLAIRDYDKRQACLAEQRRDPAGCASIRNPDNRALCRMRAGERPIGEPSRTMRKMPAFREPPFESPMRPR